ncbi:MAG: hypothetical protein OXD36_18410, partial [Rhodobacter sp.]|nr:hypothetical protein [Rhodobacter sp.]
GDQDCHCSILPLIVGCLGRETGLRARCGVKHIARDHCGAFRAGERGYIADVLRTVEALRQDMHLLAKVSILYRYPSVYWSLAAYHRPEELLSLREHEALALWLRDRPSQLLRPFDPELYRIIDIPQRCFLIVAVRQTPWQLGRRGDKCMIFIAPVENDLVLVHRSSPPSLYFRISWRTCRTL